MKERFGIHSIFVKQLICFALGNAIIVLVMTAIFLNAFQLAREEVYDRMNAQSEYYLETLDAQLENIYNLEINFFYDRRLVFLMEERRLSFFNFPRRFSSYRRMGMLAAEVFPYSSIFMGKRSSSRPSRFTAALMIRRFA